MDQAVPDKFFDVKRYIRMNADSQPELVIVEPMITADNTFVPDLVRVYIDDQREPTVYSREVIADLIQSWGCTPLEQVMNYKHKIRH